MVSIPMPVIFGLAVSAFIWIVILIWCCCVKYGAVKSMIQLTRPMPNPINPPGQVPQIYQPPYHQPDLNSSSQQQPTYYSIPHPIESLPPDYRYHHHQPPMVVLPVQLPEGQDVSNPISDSVPHTASLPSEPPQTYFMPEPEPTAQSTPIHDGDASRPNVNDTFSLDDLNSFHAQGDDKSSPCPICLEPLENEPVSTGNCLHLAHTSCLKKWLVRDQHFACPVCRVTLTDT